MTEWNRLLALTFALLLSLGAGIAPAQPSDNDPEEQNPEAQNQDGPAATGVAPETEPEGDGEGAAARATPRSPDEEVAHRRARLDQLFGQLAQKENPSWENVQQEIWSVWANSGSPSMDLILVRAARAMEAGEYELALRFLNDLVRLAPDFAEGWNKRATVFYLLEDYGHSVADIQRTLALEPRHFGALSGLGIILERLGDKPGAMRAYRRGLEIHPNLPGAAEGVERLAPEVDGREL